MLRLGSLLFTLGVAPSFAHAGPATVTRTAVQQRAVFDFVAKKTDLTQLCGGGQPLAVDYRRTAGDVAAAVFTGLWYTPIHVRVTCASPP